MTWSSPMVLWLLALVPAFAVGALAAWRWRRSVYGRVGERKSVEALVVGRRSGPWRAARAMLGLAALAALVVALAGPAWGTRIELLRRRGIDLVVALDFSKSMLARDVHPSRIERARVEVSRLLAELDGDRVGIVAFAGETIEFPMTTDRRALELFLRELGPLDMPVGGTAIGKALVASARLLERSTRSRSASERPSRVVVLVTDGEDTEGDPTEVIPQLVEAGVRVYTVGVGTATGEPIPTYSPDGTWTGYQRDADGNLVYTRLTEQGEATLRRIAVETGGKYFHAGRGSVGIDRIVSEIRRMRQDEERGRRVLVAEPRHVWPLLLAWLLLIAEALLPETWLGSRRGAKQARRESARSEAPRQPPPAQASVTARLSRTLLLGLALTGASGPSPARAWELFRSPQPDVEAGNEAMARNDPAGALAAYDRAARALPSEPGVHLNRGLALAALGREEQARAALLLATEPAAPAEVRAAAHYNIGLSHFREADRIAADAARQAVQAGSATPGAAPAPPPDAHDQASRGFREAAEAFRRALRAQPGFRDAAWNLELAMRRARQERERAERSSRGEQQQSTPPSQRSADSTSSGDDASNPSDPTSTPDAGAESTSSPDAQDAGTTPQAETRPTPGASSAAPDAGTQAPSPAGESTPDRNDAGEGSGQTPVGSGSSAAPPQGLEAPSPGSGAGAELRELPEEARRVLDALRAGEQSLQRHRARLRALREARRPPIRDW
ncbi:MAG: VWA domain-containing protein [Myxococcota bacterium]|nr:VWA domain-containing protein [Myxococcota bacterium]MDW8363592.1 VWA domain-containing protein [Myxococcales bacterium]